MSDNKKNPNPLDPSSILHCINQSVTRFQSPYDAITAAVHAILISVGFRFAGLGDDARQEGDGTQKKLPIEWNQTGPHCYNLRYSHPQSSLTFVIKIVKLGDKCIVLGLGIGDNKTAMLEIMIEDFTSNSFYPFDSETSQDPLVHGFISSARLNDFIQSVKINIIQRLLPGLNKPGYEESSTTTTTTSSSSNTRPAPNAPNTSSRERYHDPLASSPLVPPVGESDLNPLGGGSLRIPGGGDGMFVGPDHPMFGNRGGILNDPSGLFGGLEPLPRGSVPPGARFDPIGPFGGLPRPPNARGPRPPFRGEPDNDELMPPGYNDMFG
ncbi:hypothetical protein K501DRAFT_199160 [Backusella circina FSU 941]|nr:hypothetical protein K501DRAFT_199160 [Backusella circina FSU 941]